MIDERFSAEAFEASGLDSEAARQLADLLADEIQRELHLVIEPALEQVIRKLNQMGHKLTPYHQPQPGEIAYRDCSDERCVECKLRVAVDTIVSTGYAHLIYVDQFDD